MTQEQKEAPILQDACAGLEARLESAGYARDEHNIFKSGNQGYWSNLDKEENRRFLERLRTTSPLEAVRSSYPQYEQIIFSPKREAALELLDIRPGEVCADYGCMWGALSVGMAKRGGAVLAIDQTYESLAFLARRKEDEKLPNIVPAQNDVRAVELPEATDCAVVNGVLEWVPEIGEIELKRFYGKKAERVSSKESPGAMQLRFLERVLRNLKPGGRLLLAIENRYDYTQFIGKKDPHSDLWLTSILPRPVSDLISKTALGRPYVNYLYSFPALKKLLHKAGFSKVDLYMGFPDYRFPELILPYDNGLKDYYAYGKSLRDCSWKKIAATTFERIAMKTFKARFFAPSIIAMAVR